MANAKIKGITIEIGGDTTQLGKALDDTEKKSRGLQTELRAVEKLLKFDPTNTELLIQKQNVLADMIGETAKKLDVMKEAEAQVVAQFEAGEIGEDQLRAFQREIIQTEQNLASMQSELQTATRNLDEFGDNTGVAKAEAEQLARAIQDQNDALQAEKTALAQAEQAQKEHEQAVADAKQELKEFGDSASESLDKVKTGFLALSTATVAGGGYALKLTNDFDKAFNTLQTRTGATTEKMDGLNASMEAIYSNNFGESIEDVAVSMATVKNNTKLSGDELESLTEKALLMRDTFEFDVNESTRSAKMLMDQFGISGEDAYNLIAQGAQNGLDKNGDLLDTINEYSVHFEQLGLDSENMFNMLVNGAESGTFSVDKLGDSVKEFGIRVKDGSTTTQEGFNAIGLDADEMAKKFGEGGDSAKQALQETANALFAMDDPIAQNIAGVNLFGTQWEDLGVEGVQALMNLDGSISTTASNLEDINNQKYDDLGSALSGLGRTLQTDVVKPIGEELKPVVEEAIGYVKDNAPAIKDFISNLVENIGKFVGFIVDNSSVILSTIVGVGAGFVAWNVATMIMGVVSAVKAFQLANEGATVAQALLNTVMKANPMVLIASLVATLVAGIVTFIATNEEAREKIAEVWEAIKETVGEVLDNIVEFFENAWDTIKDVWSELGEFFQNLWAQIVEIFTPAIEWFSALFTTIYTTLASIIQVIIGIIQGCWNTIVAIFSVAYNWFKTTVLDPIKNAFSNAWTAVTNLASKAWSSIKTIFTPLANWFNNTIITPLQNFFSGMWSKLTNGASGAWTGIKNAFSTITTWFKSKFSEAWTAVKNVFSTGGQIFSGITEGITSAFKTTVNAIISGINTVIAVPFNAINGVLDKIRSATIAGFKPFKNLGSVSVPQIPQLARGGVVDGATLATIGEDGAEAVVPLENNTEWLNKLAGKLYDIERMDYNSTDNILLSKISEISNKLSNFNQSIVLDTGVLVGETIDQIDNRLARNYSMKARGI